MITNFFYQPSLEYERLLGILVDMVHGLYQENGFLVLPYRLPKYGKSVFLPKLLNFEPRKYFTHLKEITPYRDIPLQKTPSVVRLLRALKASQLKIEKIDLKATKKTVKNWKLLQPQFEDYFLEIFPQFRLYRIELDVFWSRFGTLVSFASLKMKGKRVLIRIFLRDDMGVVQIAEGFLSGLFLDKLTRGYQYSFLQREAVFDFLIRDTKLARLFPDFIPTLEIKPSQQKIHEHYQESIRYLKSLGLAIKPGISLSKNRILINSEFPHYPFSPTEEEILKRLITTANEPVSYYDLGDLIWKDNLDKFWHNT